MKIVTAGDEKFKEMVGFSVRTAKKLGYETIIFDLGGLGVGKRYEIKRDDFSVGKHYGVYAIKVPFKPKLLKRALEKTDEFLVWLDGDAFLISKIDEVVGDYDIGVTMRRQEERGKSPYPSISGYINAGVLFINNTKGARKFIDMWIKEIPNTKSGSDQEALNSLIKQVTDFKGGCYNKIYNLDDIKIKIFKTDIYNHYYFDETLEQAKIVHFKGSRRQYYNKYKTKYEV